MKDKSSRLIKLFRDTGFIKENDWESYAKAKKNDEGGKPLMDILKSEVSIKTFKELFTLEIKNPFASSEEKDSSDEHFLEIENILEQSLEISAAEILHILQNNNTELKPLCKMIAAEKPAIKDKINDFTEDLSAKTTKKDYRFFVDHGLLTPQSLSGILQKAANSYSRENRLNLAFEILSFNGVLTHTDLAEAITASQTGKTTLIDVLEVKKGITGERILKLIQQGLYLPSVEIDAIKPDKSLLKIFPQSFVVNHSFIPFEKNQKMISIAVADPLNFALVDAISILTGSFVFPYFASQSEILDAINSLYKGKVSRHAVSEDEDDEVPEPPPKREAKYIAEKVPAAAAAPRAEPQDRQMKIQGVEAMVDSKSTVQLVSAIIENAIATRSTDIHLEPQETELRVRYRIDGNLHKVMAIPLELHLPVISRIKVLSNMDVTERRRPQDGQFSLKVKDTNFDFRISSLPTHFGEKIVLRVLDETAVIKGLEDLGLDESQKNILQALIEKPYGMILVTGPTGSGKTTTLYSAMNLLNDMSRNIVTIEDPVEYKLKGINQVQVDPNIELTFASGLRSILRQDPDVIMVGEIRDIETAKIAIRSALTGHLVFSTLHTNTSAGAISALVNLDIQRFSIAAALLCVISQRLVRKICPHCIKGFKPDAGLKRDLGVESKSTKQMYKGNGCDYCFQTGYSGRFGLYELLVVNDIIKDLIISGGSEKDILDAAVKKNKMLPLESAGLEAIFDKKTSPEEVLEQVFLV